MLVIIMRVCSSSSCRWEACRSGSWRGELWALSSAFGTVPPLVTKLKITYMVLDPSSATHTHKTHVRCWPMSLLIINMCLTHLYQTAATGKSLITSDYTRPASVATFRHTPHYYCYYHTLLQHYFTTKLFRGLQITASICSLATRI